MSDSMTTEDVRVAVLRAKSTIAAADREVGSMANLIAGRLRNSSAYHSTLVALKQELADYNMQTGRWKKK